MQGPMMRMATWKILRASRPSKPGHGQLPVAKTIQRGWFQVDVTECNWCKWWFSRNSGLQVDFKWCHQTIYKMLLNMFYFGDVMGMSWDTIGAMVSCWGWRPCLCPRRMVLSTNRARSRLASARSLFGHSEGGLMWFVILVITHHVCHIKVIKGGGIINGIEPYHIISHPFATWNHGQHASPAVCSHHDVLIARGQWYRKEWLQWSQHHFH